MTKAMSRKDFVLYQKYIVLQLHSWVKYNAPGRAQAESPGCSFYLYILAKICGAEQVCS